MRWRVRLFGWGTPNASNTNYYVADSEVYVSIESTHKQKKRTLDGLWLYQIGNHIQNTKFIVHGNQIL